VSQVSQGQIFITLALALSAALTFFGITLKLKEISSSYNNKLITVYTLLIINEYLTKSN